MVSPPFCCFTTRDSEFALLLTRHVSALEKLPLLNSDGEPTFEHVSAWARKAEQLVVRVHLLHRLLSVVFTTPL